MPTARYVKQANHNRRNKLKRKETVKDSLTQQSLIKICDSLAWVHPQPDIFFRSLQYL